jgi:8-oxo-dGTP diphosphatase
VIEDPQSSVSARFSICALEDAEGRLLFVKRSPEESLGAGKWGFPAGHIEAGETPRECARREMMEEIGQHHEIIEVNQVGPIRDTFYGGKFEINLFHFHWSSGTVELNHEHTAFTWASAAEFKKLDVMLGIEQDIVLLGIWPRAMFDPARLAAGDALD